MRSNPYGSGMPGNGYGWERGEPRSLSPDTPIWNSASQ